MTRYLSLLQVKAIFMKSPLGQAWDCPSIALLLNSLGSFESFHFHSTKLIVTNHHLYLSLALRPPSTFSKRASPSRSTLLSSANGIFHPGQGDVSFEMLLSLSIYGRCPSSSCRLNSYRGLTPHGISLRDHWIRSQDYLMLKRNPWSSSSMLLHLCMSFSSNRCSLRLAWLPPTFVVSLYCNTVRPIFCLVCKI